MIFDKIWLWQIRVREFWHKRHITVFFSVFFAYAFIGMIVG